MRSTILRIATLLALLVAVTVQPSQAALQIHLATAGPGGRIHGIDISRWQHPGDAPIDFKKMYRAGIRFVIIKGADTIDRSDAMALKYLQIDRPAAHQARLFTGFYYYATLPDTSSTTMILSDAKAQAQKAIWRLSTIGGYGPRDLPMSLDLENNCVRTDQRGNCTRYLGKKYVTLWVQTWLDTVATATNRRPFIYSYPQFLQTAMTRSTSLTQYPLWVAAYNKNPTDPSSQPGVRTVGCFAHAWTKSDCTTNWQIWQYTSCGIGAKYGIPSARVDLNVFGGNSSDFYQLTRGLWQPTAADLLPVDEPTTMKIVSSASATTNDPVTFVVDVFRPDGTPVVTGSVDFASADSLMTSGTQNVVRSATGRWTLTLTNMQAGNYLGVIEFKDDTGTHAPSSTPVQFVVTQGPTPTPTPTPTSSPTPSKKPKPVNPCAGQFIN